jgi:hypothetical protein
MKPSAPSRVREPLDKRLDKIVEGKPFVQRFDCGGYLAFDGGKLGSVPQERRQRLVRPLTRQALLLKLGLPRRLGPFQGLIDPQPDCLDVGLISPQGQFHTTIVATLGVKWPAEGVIEQESRIVNVSGTPSTVERQVLLRKTDGSFEVQQPPIPVQEEDGGLCLERHAFLL